MNNRHNGQRRMRRGRGGTAHAGSRSFRNEEIYYPPQSMSQAPYGQNMPIPISRPHMFRQPTPENYYPPQPMSQVPYGQNMPIPHMLGQPTPGAYGMMDRNYQESIQNATPNDFPNQRAANLNASHAQEYSSLRSGFRGTSGGRGNQNYSTMRSSLRGRSYTSFDQGINSNPVYQRNHVTEAVSSNNRNVNERGRNRSWARSKRVNNRNHSESHDMDSNIDFDRRSDRGSIKSDLSYCSVPLKFNSFGGRNNHRGRGRFRKSSNRGGLDMSDNKSRISDAGSSNYKTKIPPVVENTLDKDESIRMWLDQGSSQEKDQLSSKTEKQRKLKKNQRRQRTIISQDNIDTVDIAADVNRSDSNSVLDILDPKESLQSDAHEVNVKEVFDIILKKFEGQAKLSSLKTEVSSYFEGYNQAQLLGWFKTSKQAKDWFRVFENECFDMESVITCFRRPLKLCFRYMQSSSCPGNCSYLHICIDSLANTCNRPRCKYNHNIFDRKNKSILGQVGLCSSYSSTEVLNLVRTTNLKSCNKYNTQRKCDEMELGSCPDLHICQDYIRKKCRKEDCELGHDILSDLCKKTLQIYELNHLSSNIIEKRVLVLSTDRASDLKYSVQQMSNTEYSGISSYRDISENQCSDTQSSTSHGTGSVITDDEIHNNDLLDNLAIRSADSEDDSMNAGLTDFPQNSRNENLIDFDSQLDLKDSIFCYNESANKHLPMKYNCVENINLSFNSSVEDSNDEDQMTMDHRQDNYIDTENFSKDIKLTNIDAVPHNERTLVYVRASINTLEVDKTKQSENPIQYIQNSAEVEPILKKMEHQTVETKHYSRNDIVYPRFNIDELSFFVQLLSYCNGISNLADLKENFSNLFGSVASQDVAEWYRQSELAKKLFLLFPNSAEDHTFITVFIKELKVCYAYSQKCKKQKCPCLHLCKEFISGNCRNQSGTCRYSHDVKDPHNNEIFKKHLLKHNLYAKLNEQCLLNLVNCSRLKLCVQHITSEDGICKNSKSCPYLHICDRYLKGRCMISDHKCQYKHDIKSKENIKILQKYDMDMLSSDIIKRIVFLPHINSRTWLLLNPGSSIPQTNIQDTDRMIPICELDLRGVCKLGNDCKEHHYIRPYLWQINRHGTWIGLDLDDSFIRIEEKFCDVENDVIDLDISDPERVPGKITIDFQNMTWTSVDYESGKVRRLSTESYVKIESDTGSIEHLCTRWVWYWQDEHRNWNLYEYENIPYQDVLEAKYNHGDHFAYFQLGKNSYIIDLNTMTQTNIVYQTPRPVKRRPIFTDSKVMKDFTIKNDPANCKHYQPSKLPSGWSPMDCVTPNVCDRILLKPTDKAYRSTEMEFFKTMDRSRFQIKEIFRIQNKTLWDAFTSQMSKMKIPNPYYPIDQRNLFHGTDNKETVDCILHQSFDPRMHGKNATMYGKGAYFALEAKYSNSYTGSGKEKTMFYAKVLVGKTTLGCSNMQRPPPLNISKPYGELYDTCVNDEVSPTIFVVFKSEQCYPEYLIHYIDNRFNTIPFPVTTTTTNASFSSYNPSSTAQYSTSHTSHSSSSAQYSTRHTSSSSASNSNSSKPASGKKESSCVIS